MSTMKIWEEHIIKAKSFDISKKMVWEAYKRVKTNGEAPGVDGKTIEMFEAKLQDNLYKIWNRMSSGSYFPSSVRLVDIPKSDGSKRRLGIPTVADRVAQMVVKMYLEPKVDPRFHKDSYGYRPGKSALEAVGVTRKRSWEFDWVIDLDIKGFFDNIDHALMMRAVKKYSDEKWVLLYIERWLKVSGQTADGEVLERFRGTPQGGVISPLLANIFLHHAFDVWMQEEFPRVPFERYADDIIVHCTTKKQADYVLTRIRQRLKKCELEVHPEKTKIVYCKDDNRKDDYDNTSFDFLGYTFRPRLTRGKDGRLFVGFTPGVSSKSLKMMCAKIRSWNLVKMTPMTLADVAEKINPVIRGWINYFGVYFKSALSPVLRQLDLTIAKWAMRKYKKLHRKFMRATRWITGISRRNPECFAHWVWKLGKA
jgi:RNA-directed DNA polymerase